MIHHAINDDTLTLWSFHRYASDLCFRHAQRGDKSASALGWQVFADTAEHILEWKPQLRAVTAEGVAMLAATVDVLSRSARVSLTGLPPILHEAIQQPLMARHMAQGIQFHKIADARVVLPHKIQLEGEDDCGAYARLLAELLSSEGRRVNRDMASVRESIELALLEVFNNALEHGRQGYALFSAALQTGRGIGVDHLEAHERDWVQRNSHTQILEIAVCDVGAGVPASLEASFVAEFADSIADLRKLASGSRAFKEARRELHTAICEWAFAHYSTSKQLHVSQELRNDSLNWRGLHRAWGYVNWHSGMVALTSGQARTGFAAGTQGTNRIRYKNFAAIPVPGTMITLRYGKRPFKHRSESIVTGPRTHDGAVAVPLIVHRTGGTKPAGTDGQFQGTFSQPKATEGAVTLRPVVHAFREGWLATSRSRDLEELRRISPDMVAVHYFTDASSERLFSLLAEDFWSPATGSPRLIGAWTPRDGLLWTVAGRVPPGSGAWFREFGRERAGRLPENAAQAAVVLELVKHFPGRITIEGSLVRLIEDGVKITFSTLGKLASEALTIPGVCDEAVFISAENECVLLSDGTRVTRYFSLTALLTANETIREVAAFLLAHQLKLLRQQHGDFVVVTPTLASYYLARMLLRISKTLPGAEERFEPDVYLIGNRPDTHRNVAVFQTASRAGVTLAEAVARAGPASVVAAIVGVDLGLQHAKRTSMLPTVRSLFRYDFDPYQLSHDDAHQPERVICTVTDWPVRVDNPSDVVATTIGRKIVTKSPNVFSFGLQAIDSRAHVMALPGNKVVAEAADLLLDWIVAQTWVELERIGVRHVLFVGRSETALFGIIPRLADRLYAMSNGSVAVQRLAVPAVQPSGRSVIYGHVADGRAAGREDMRRQRSLVSEDLPSGEYCAVYLDTSAVTGKNFRSVVNLLRDSDPMPRSLLFLPITNRLSPREEKFVTGIKMVSRHDDAVAAEVRFASIFRLQVGSWEHSEVTPVARFFRELDMPDVRARPDTASYLDRLRDRLASVAHDVGAGRKTSDAIGHFYTPDDDVAANISLEAVQLRHLLSLYHQNRPVLTELLTLYHHLIQTRDISVLSVVALEPDLMRQPPLLLEGWQDLQLLAEHAIASTNSTSVLSDALVVAGAEFDAWMRNLRAIVSVVDRKRELWPLVRLLAARLTRSSPAAGQHLIQGVENLPAHARTVAADLIAFVKARMSLTWPGPPTFGADRSAPIHRLISLMYAHSPAHTTWRNADKFFTMNTPPLPALPESVLNAIRVAKAAIMPALKATVEQARVTDSLDIAQELEAATFNSNDAISLELASSSGTTADNGAAAKEAWLALRAQTFTGSPESFLGQLALPPEHTGLLEKGLRKFVCLPLELVLDYLHESGTIGDHLLGAVPVPEGYANVTRKGGGHYALEVGIDAIRQLLDIILDNYRMHGRAGTLRVAYRERDTVHGLTLELAFRNLIGPEVISGGRGLLLLRALCEQFGIPPARNRSLDDLFELTLQLRPIAYVRWDAEASDAVLHNR